MNNLFDIYLPLALLILFPILVLLDTEKSLLNRILGVIAFTWILGFLFFSRKLWDIEMGPLWFLLISPGFAILIYVRCKESKKTRDEEDSADSLKSPADL